MNLRFILVKIQILKRYLRVNFVIRVTTRSPTEFGALKIIAHLNWASGVEDVGHYNEIYSLDTSRLFNILDLMQSKKPRNKCLRELDHMFIILIQYLLQSIELCVTYCF